MKIALITDTHYGARGDSEGFHSFFEKFYLEQFFPYLVEHNIKEVIHLGDMFDRRKYINFVSLSRCRKYFFEPTREHGIKVHAIIGNHDTSYKNTNEINSPNLLLKEYDNIMLTNGIAPSPQVGQTIVDLEPLRNELISLKSVIANKSEVTIMNNESGTRYYERVNGQRRELVNSVLTMKSRSVR